MALPGKRIYVDVIRTRSCGIFGNAHNLRWPPPQTPTPQLPPWPTRSYFNIDADSMVDLRGSMVSLKLGSGAHLVMRAKDKIDTDAWGRVLENAHRIASDEFE